jgi:cytochrome b561
MIRHGSVTARTAASAGHVPGSLSVTQSIGWVSMTLPLLACVAIWAIGNTSPTNVAWLSVLHKMIGVAASAWTVLRFVVRRRTPTVPQPARRLSVRASLATIYALLALQLLLALAGSMLHGDKTTLFGFRVPSILPVDPPLALRIDRLHGWNAVVLLALILMHVAAALFKMGNRGQLPLTPPDQTPRLALGGAAALAPELAPRGTRVNVVAPGSRPQTQRRRHRHR